MRLIKSDKELERLLDEQAKEIEREYGKRAAKWANYGWGQDDYSVCTKVYGARMAVTSYYVGKEVRHEHNSL